MTTEQWQGGAFANFRLPVPHNAGSHSTHCSTQPKSPFLSVLQNECQINTMLEGYTFNRTPPTHTHTHDTDVNEGGLPHPLPKVSDSQFQRCVHRRTHLHLKGDPNALGAPDSSPAPALPSQHYINNTSPAANGRISIFSPACGA